MYTKKAKIDIGITATTLYQYALSLQNVFARYITVSRWYDVMRLEIRSLLPDISLFVRNSKGF